jgi:hypothetical protein
MIFVWAMVILIGVIIIVLGPVLFVTKQMVLIGIVLGALGVLGFQRTARCERPDHPRARN